MRLSSIIRYYYYAYYYYYRHRDNGCRHLKEVDVHANHIKHCDPTKFNTISSVSYNTVALLEDYGPILFGGIGTYTTRLSSKICQSIKTVNNYKILCTHKCDYICVWILSCRHHVFGQDECYRCDYFHLKRSWFKWAVHNSTKMNDLI